MYLPYCVELTTVTLAILHMGTTTACLPLVNEARPPEKYLSSLLRMNYTAQDRIIKTKW